MADPIPSLRRRWLLDRMVQYQLKSGARFISSPIYDEEGRVTGYATKPRSDYEPPLAD